jgi:hypothetical protein
MLYERTPQIDFTADSAIRVAYLPQVLTILRRINTACAFLIRDIVGSLRQEDQLAGRTPEVTPEQEQRDTQTCIDLFLQDKENQGVTDKVRDKYTRELARLRSYCERNNVFTIWVQRRCFRQRQRFSNSSPWYLQSAE